MTISVHGIGWVTKEGYGCVRSGQRQSFENGEGRDSLPKKDIFSHPFKNFGRLDNVSRMTCYAVALALQDAGVEYAPGRKRDLGIIGTSSEGSLRTDTEYFRDYVNSGRTLSRGNLFIYTLPSSPFGEAAIHFGFLGPLLYAASKENGLVSLFDAAHDMVSGNETAGMLAGKAGEDESVFFVIARNSGAALCSLAEARSIVESVPDISGTIEKFSVFETGKSIF